MRRQNGTSHLPDSTRHGAVKLSTCQILTLTKSAVPGSIERFTLSAFVLTLPPPTFPAIRLAATSWMPFHADELPQSTSGLHPPHCPAPPPGGHEAPHTRPDGRDDAPCDVSARRQKGRERDRMRLREREIEGFIQALLHNTPAAHMHPLGCEHQDALSLF